MMILTVNGIIGQCQVRFRFMSKSDPLHTCPHSIERWGLNKKHLELNHREVNCAKCNVIIAPSHVILILLCTILRVDSYMCSSMVYHPLDPFFRISTKDDL